LCEIVGNYKYIEGIHFEQNIKSDFYAIARAKHRKHYVFRGCSFVNVVMYWRLWTRYLAKLSWECQQT